MMERIPVAKNSFWVRRSHIIPVDKGGTDDLANLQPLHWDNNAAKGDGSLVCKVVADGTHNRIRNNWNLLLG